MRKIFPIIVFAVLVGLVGLMIADSQAVSYVTVYTEDNTSSPSVQTPVESLYVYLYKNASTQLDSALTSADGVVRFDTTTGSSMRLKTKDTTYVIEDIQIDVNNAADSDTLVFALRVFEAADCSLHTITFRGISVYGARASNERIKVVEYLSTSSVSLNDDGDKGVILFAGDEPKLETTIRTDASGMVEYRCFRYSTVAFYHNNKLITWKSDITADTDITAYSPTF